MRDARCTVSPLFPPPSLHLLAGAVQSLFEGAMYIFVLQWPPAVKAAIQASRFGPAAATPFGAVFSCFMACCLLGSTAFGALQAKVRPPGRIHTHPVPLTHYCACPSAVQNVRTETSTSVMLVAAAAAMTAASAIGGSSLGALVRSPPLHTLPCSLSLRSPNPERMW